MHCPSRKLLSLLGPGTRRCKEGSLHTAVLVRRCGAALVPWLAALVVSREPGCGRRASKMSTYGYLHGQHVTVNMTEAVFDSVTAGVRHVMVVAVRNISKRGLRVRFTPPRSPAFKLHLQNDVELAPGLQMEAELAYFAETPADVEDLMVIDVGRAGGESERIKIPVRALVPGAKLNFDTPLDFGAHSRRTSPSPPPPS